MLSGAYDAVRGEIYVQFSEKIQAGKELVDKFTTQGYRADKIQEMESGLQIYEREHNMVSSLVKHSDLFNETLIVDQVSRQIIN